MIMAEYQLSYAANDIDERLRKAGDAILSTPQTLIEAQKAQARENIGASSTCYKWIIPNVEIVDGVAVQVYETNKIAKYSGDAFKHIVVDVADFEKIIVSGYQWDASYGYYLVVFVNANQKVVSKYEAAKQGKYDDVELVVPEGATFAYVNGHATNQVTCSSACKRYDVSTLEDEKANRMSAWATIPVTPIVGKLLYDSGTIFDHSMGCYATFDVGGFTKVEVHGYQFAKSSFSVCQFRDREGAQISVHRGEQDNTRVSLTLDVPSNAVTLTVNGHILGDYVKVRGYKAYDVEDLYNALKPVGRKLITLGDSITALGVGDTGWVKYFLEKTECQLVANVAVNGACLNDKAGTVYDGNPVFNGADDNVNNVLGNQVQKIINNAYETPDIIMIAIGTNGGISITKEQIKAAYYDSNNALIPLENVDRTTSAGAYRWCLEKLHATYPNAVIFWCAPIMGEQTIRSAENAMAYAESLRIATEYTGQIMIDTIRCGINGINEVSGANGQYLVDGLHPNVNGAKKIGYYNASKVMPFLGNAFVLQ